MTTRMLPLAAVLAAALALAGAATPAVAGDDPQEATTMTRTARGDFEVKVAPVAQDDLPDGAAMGRYSLDKTYHGDLAATGKGEMLTAGTPVEGSAAYVAIEHVKGTLGGRKGSFILQHHGTMGHGEQHLEITVIPDSGTGELVGLAGSLAITIADGKHSYALEYTLPDA
jgi:hypothetical protein